MTANPWWYSGSDASDASDAPADAPTESADEAPGEAPGQARRIDLASLTTGAQQIVDFARQTLLVPHAGHRDPSEHPDCVVCRTMAIVGQVSTSRAAARPESRGIEWIVLDPPT